MSQEAKGFLIARVKGLDDEVLDAGVGEGLEVGDDTVWGAGDAGVALVGGDALRVVAVPLGLGAGVVLGEDEPGREVGAEDVVVGATNRFAVAAENVELVADVVGGANAPRR